MKFNKSEIEKIYKKNDLASHLNDEYHTKLFIKNILSNFINEWKNLKTGIIKLGYHP